MATDPIPPGGNQVVLGFPFGIPIIAWPTGDQARAAADAVPKLQLAFLRATQEILQALTEVTQDQIDATQRSVGSRAQGVPSPTNSASRATPPPST